MNKSLIEQRDLLVIALNEAVSQHYRIQPWWQPNDKIKNALLAVDADEVDKILGVKTDKHGYPIEDNNE